MKLTKGKVSKLLNKRKQTMKRIKNKGKPKKHKRTFRKSRPLNLHNKTLKKYKKMKGGDEEGEKNVSFGNEEIVEFNKKQPTLETNPEINNSLDIVTNPVEVSPSPLEEKIIEESSVPEPVVGEGEKKDENIVEFQPEIEEFTPTVEEKEQPLEEFTPTVDEEKEIPLETFAENIVSDIEENDIPSLENVMETEKDVEETPTIPEEEPVITEKPVVENNLESALKVVIENIEENIADKVYEKISLNNPENLNTNTDAEINNAVREFSTIDPGKDVKDALDKFIGGKKKRTRKYRLKMKMRKNKTSKH